MNSAQLAARLQPFRHHRRWWVAYSGGLDSHVLLDLCWRLGLEGGWPPLAAVHINHQLSPSANAWAAHCEAICTELKVPLVTEAVTVTPAGLGIEAAARTARYAAFAALLGPGELLLQAHHADDQAETVLLRLLRGSNPLQLAAVPATRPLGQGELLRPLLTEPRSELERHARAAGLVWIEDDSNAEDRFDRNYVRHRVTPVLARRWPRYRVALAQVAAQASELRLLLDDVAAADLTSCGEDGHLIAACCRALTPSRQANLLRYWIRQRGLPEPGGGPMRQLLAMLQLDSDAAPLVRWPGAEVRWFRGRLFAMSPLSRVDAWPAYPWRADRPADLGAAGRLIATLEPGAGLRCDGPLEVRMRYGGERCQPAGRAHSQTLRRLLQEYALPPWLRDRLPLVYCGGDLVAVADLWVCEGFQARSGEAGWQLQWLSPEGTQWAGRGKPGREPEIC